MLQELLFIKKIEKGWFAANKTSRDLQVPNNLLMVR